MFLLLSFINGSFHFTKLNINVVLFISGASIRACKGLFRHVVALEEDKDLYNEVLVPLKQKSDESESPPPSPHLMKRPASKFDASPEVKKAQKRKCE